MRRLLVLAFAAVAAVLLCASDSAQGQDTSSPDTIFWDSIPLPGGARAVSAAAGYPTPIERSRLMLELIHRLHGSPAGYDPAAVDLETRLGTYFASAPPDSASDGTVPLPLSHAFWCDVIFRRQMPIESLAVSILMDRSAALMYYGLAALDPETLAFFEGQGDTLAYLSLLRSGAFAAWSRSIHIRNGRVVAPGGEGATELWRAIVGEDVTAPDQFVRSLFQNDEGRLAFFYDTIAHLSPERQRFTMPPLPSARDRRRQFETLYSRFVAANPDWSSNLRPFTRALVDPPFVLRTVAVTPDGTLAEPASTELWGSIFERSTPIGESADARAVATEAGASGRGAVARLEAADLVELIALAPIAVRRERLDTVLFAQRVFGDAIGRVAAAELRTAIRGFARYPALMLTLERMGIRDAAVYGIAARAAASLDDVSTQQAIVALSQLQAATGLIERMVFSRTLDSAGAVSLLKPLFEIRPDAEGRYLGRIARWIEASLIPAIRPIVQPRETNDVGPEITVLRALAGKPSETLTEVAWEGSRYLLDLAAGELDRLTGVRAVQISNSLDRVLEFSKAAADMSQRSDLAKARDEIARLKQIIEVLELKEASLRGRPPVTSRVAALFESTLRESQRRGFTRADTETILWAGDMLLAETLTSLLYATSIGEPDGAAASAGGSALAHDLASDLSNEKDARPPWQLAVEQPSTGRQPWHLRGSLLGIDMALARHALRRIVVDQPPVEQALSEIDRAAFAQAMALMNPRDLTDEGRAWLLRAIERGRRRFDDFMANPLDAAAVFPWWNEWRVQAFPWMLKNEQDEIARSVSLLELLWLGADGTPPPETTSWGSSIRPLRGCFCSGIPAPEDPFELAGRAASGLLPTYVPDLNLRLAQILAELELPSPLARGVLSAAMQDFIDQVRPGHQDDWFALTREAQRLTREGVEDYVSSLAASGPLQPIKRDEELLER